MGFAVCVGGALAVHWRFVLAVGLAWDWRRVGGALAVGLAVCVGVGLAVRWR